MNRFATQGELYAAFLGALYCLAVIAFEVAHVL